MVAEVIINSIVKNLNRIFDYNIPKELEDDVKVEFLFHLVDKSN